MAFVYPPAITEFTADYPGGYLHSKALRQLADIFNPAEEALSEIPIKRNLDARILFTYIRLFQTWDSTPRESDTL